MARTSIDPLMTARWWHALTFAVVLAALVLQVYLVFIGARVLIEGDVPPLTVRLARLVCYFTIQSNVLVAVVSGMLARRPARDGPLFRVLRLDSVVAICVTALVHYVALRPILNLTGGSYWADLGLHVVVPILAVIGWAVFGPRPRVDLRTVCWALVWPIAWLAITLLIGALSGWYPYPFLDAGTLGYPRVLLTSLVVTLVFLALIGLVALVDRRAPQAPRSGPEEPAARAERTVSGH